MNMSSRIKFKAFGGATPQAENLRPGRDTVSSQVAEDVTASGAAGALTRVNYSTQPVPRNPVNTLGPVKNCPASVRGHSSTAVGQRFPFATRALSGWYVPSPDLVNRPWVYLNGRNAEYSGLLGLYVSRPVPEPDREEKGLFLPWRQINEYLQVYDGR